MRAGKGTTLRHSSAQAHLNLCSSAFLETPLQQGFAFVTADNQTHPNSGFGLGFFCESNINKKGKGLVPLPLQSPQKKRCDTHTVAPLSSL